MEIDACNVVLILIVYSDAYCQISDMVFRWDLDLLVVMSVCALSRPQVQRAFGDTVTDQQRHELMMAVGLSFGLVQCAVCVMA